MLTVRKAMRFLLNKQYRTDVRFNLGRFDYLQDEQYLKKKFQNTFGYELDLENPRTYNEKIQWLKLYDRRPLYPQIADKYAAKEYIDRIVGPGYTVPLLGVWERAEDVDFSLLPARFVLKCTHDCGGIVICKDKGKFDWDDAKKRLSRALSRDYYKYLREWPYSQIQPRIIAEPYLEDSKTKELRDYKFFGFDGEVPIMFVASDRQNKNEETKFDFFDMDYRHLDLINGHPNAKTIPEKPISFHTMMELASRLSKGFPHLRVDFYEVDGRPFIGELTLYHWSGMVPFQPKEWDEKLGEFINLPFTNTKIG